MQNYLAHRVASSLSEKTHSRIELGSATIAFPHTIVLNNFYAEDRQHDTLMYFQSLRADIDLFGLLFRDVRLTNIGIDSLTAHITRTLPDSSFNFSFLLASSKSDSHSPGPSGDVPDGKGWTYMLGGATLRDCRLSYSDDVAGLDATVNLGVLDLSLDRFDLKTNQFHINRLTLENSSASLVQSLENNSPPEDSQPFDMGIGTVSLMNIQLQYVNTISGDRFGVELGNASLSAGKVDLPSRRIAVRRFVLENTNIHVLQQSRKDTAGASPSGNTTLVFSLDQLILKGNSVQYDVEGAPGVMGLDPNHLHVTDLTMQAEDIYVSESRLAAHIEHTFLRERAGFELRELSCAAMLDSSHAQLADFTLETPASHITQDIILTYSSLLSLARSPGNIMVKATIRDSRIGMSDFLYFRPSLSFNKRVPTTATLSAQLSGLVKDLHVEEFRLSAGESTLVDLSGFIRGLPDVETAFFDLTLDRFSSTRTDIHAFLSDTLIPKSITVPVSMTLNGRFKGTMKDFTASSSIGTSIGSLSATVTVASGDGIQAQPIRWNASLTARDFNVGSLLNDPQMYGPVSLRASAAGTGMSEEDLEAQLSMEVDKAVLNGYEYRNLAVSGHASRNMFGGKAEMEDSSIAFAFNGTVNLSDENPIYKFTFDLKGADLHRLNITPDDVRMAGIITTDLTGRDLNNINGTFEARNVVVIKNRRRYVVDSLRCISLNQDGQTHISIESPIFDARFDGTIALGDLPVAVKEHCAHYFPLQEGQHTGGLPAQAFTFNIALRDPTILTDLFLPELRRISAATVEGNYNSDKRNLNIHVDLPGADYNDFKIESLAVSITSDADRLQAILRVGSISDSTLRVTNLQLDATAGHDTIDVALQSSRSDGSIKMLLAGLFTSVPGGYKLSIKKDGIVFHDVRWEVPSDNYLVFGKDRLVAHDLVLRGAGQALSLRSTDEKASRSPLRIEFNDFDLGTLSHVVERDSGLFDGILTGNVVLQNLEGQTAFTSDLILKDFSFSQSLVGDVTLHANHQTENVYEVRMDIAGNGNQIAMKGHYRSEKTGDELDLTLDFTKVNLASIEPFTFGKVKRLSGTMTGGLHMTGTMKKPSITGELNFADAAFNPRFLDSYLHLNNGRVEIDGKGVDLKSFDLIDTLGNVASLSGRLFTEDFRSYRYDLRVHTDRFLLLNKPASRDALYFGTVIVDSDISVKGDQRRPIITIQAELGKGTNLALVLPESELAVEERRGLVRFVDVTTPPNSILSRRNLRTNRDTVGAGPSSMDLTSNISVNKESKLRILVDPVAGDSLVIRGEATLSFSIDPSGKLTLTGRYEILEGSYQLSFGDFIRREFAIAGGSSLTWVGSPYEADVDITAIYTVKAAVLDLIQDQLSGASQEERNKYKQELPIQVYLMMKGKLLKPEIHFKLDLPPGQRGVLNGTVYAKLNELNGRESELNRQISALLILGRFIAENPFASGGGVSDFARSSVSQIISAQLSRLADQYLAGANLNVGLDSYQDYSTGSAEGRTQLKLALSKQLFDERVTVQVGGNVDIEGRRSQQNSLNNFTGDLKVSYKLTGDGRWQMQVFRQNSYEGAIDGDITKTGVGIVFSIDFDKLFGITLKPVPDEEVK
jgi:hypothetical protein